MAKKHTKLNYSALPRDSASSYIKQSIKRERSNVYSGSHHSKRERSLVQKWRSRNPTDTRDFSSALKQAKYERGAPLRNFGRASLDGFSSVYGITRIFAFCVGILLLCALIGSLAGTTDNNRTFAGFLEWLPSVKQVSLDWLKAPSFEIPPVNFGDFFLLDWLEGLVNWIYNLINAILTTFDTPLRIIGWFCSALINVVLFILEFLGWIFMGV